MAAAREEFGANGFDGTKMEHIARRAGVSKQLVYFYFSGKEELYGELVKQMSRTSFEHLLTIDFGSMTPINAIRTYIEAVFERFLTDPVLAVVTIDQSLHDGRQLRMPPEAMRLRERLSERLAETLERGRADGTFGHHVDTDNLEFMTTIIVSGCVSSRRMFEQFAGSFEKPALWRDYAVDFILRALRD